MVSVISSPCERPRPDPDRNRAKLGGVIDVSARLLRLLFLLQTRPGWAGPELAAAPEVSARTLRPDVDRLLDDDEAVAVAIGLRTVADGGISGIEEASIAALRKLDQVLPSPLRQRVDTLHAVTVTVPERQGEVGRWRTFRLDRIRLHLTTGPRYFSSRPQPDGNLRGYPSRQLGFAMWPQRATVRAHAPADTIAGRTSGTDGRTPRRPHLHPHPGRRLTRHHRPGPRPARLRDPRAPGARRAPSPHRQALRPAATRQSVPW